MQYGTVPHFAKPISKVVLGIMPLPTDDHPRAFEIMDLYREMGGNAIDNAKIYGPGRASLMRAYYEARGEDALIRIDKGCHHGSQDDAGRRVTREAMAEDIRANLEGQGVSYSDFFVLHRDDPRVPVGDVVQWLNEHKEAGRIRAFGGSNWHHTRIEQANEFAEKHGMQGFSLSSPNLSLATVNEPMWWEAYTVDREGRDWYERTGFPLFAWSSVSGWFADATGPNITRVYENQENRERRERARALGAKKGLTTYQIALAWTLNQPMNVWALVGPDTAEQMRMNMETVEVKLEPEELRFLERGTEM
jgi:aryl-alcohol dehydrogenase-like predicted oxidoreductase